MEARSAELSKAYEPGPVEAKWLERWDRARLFHSDAAGRTDGRARGERYVVVIPPPNVTGALHIGHALNNTLQDVLVRAHRLVGYETCWVPGTDHGGIATQNVMEKQLKAEGKARHELGREAFVERMQAWTRDCKKTILGQLRRLGCALDWQREAFTMDEPRAKAVFHAFKALWEQGLIYRGERLVNWCVRCGTALSDIEVEREERKGALWHIHYPLEDGAEGAVVATTRPETMFGDTAVAINPKDERWRRLVGKKVRIPLIDRVIPIVEDAAVEFEFGTGCLKVTPAHDQADWEIGQRHGLPALKAIAPDGKLTSEAGPYAGLSREKARDQVPADLDAKGFLKKKEDHKSALGVCYRCGSVIEPLLSLQWFVKQTELAKKPLAALESGDFKLHPENWTKAYRQWLVDIKDWCVSRQIWWGHRIPVWYKDGEKPLVSQTSPGPGWTQDPDVLDTWFSSALWPLSVFGWPERTADLAAYYPTSTLVTGYEILFLWVARMQMMGLLFEGKVPFADAVIHGIVRDKSGKKMSKSLGNVIDPLVMMDKYGTDALRFSLVAQAHPGRDIPFAEDSITGARNFCNKLWNSTRFVLTYLPPSPDKPYKLEELSHCCLELSDKWILAEYEAALSQAREAIFRRDPAAAADALYAFAWDKFCSWYVELAKPRLQGVDGESKQAARAILVNVLSGTLKALHPFMPFITEELYSALRPHTGETAEFIWRAAQPALPIPADEAARERMRPVMLLVDELRSLRSQLQIHPEARLKVLADAEVPEPGYIATMAKVESFERLRDGRPPRAGTAVAAGVTLYVPLEGLVDFDKERLRLQKEAEKAAAELAKIAQKIENPNFRARAPKDEVELSLAQHKAAQARLAKLRDTIASLS